MYGDVSTQRYNQRREATLRNGLFLYLRANRIRSEMEMQMLQGRCDIAVGDRSGVKILIEVKIADPIRGIGQLFGYSWGVSPMPLKVLAMPRSMDISDMVCAALAASNTKLWWLEEDGTPFFCLGQPKYLADSMEETA